MRYIDTRKTPHSLAELGIEVGIAPPDFLLLCETSDSDDSMLFLHDVQATLEAEFGPKVAFVELTIAPGARHAVRRLAINPDDAVLARARQLIKAIQGTSSQWPQVDWRVHQVWDQLPLGERASLVQQHGLAVDAMLEQECPDELLTVVQWMVET